MKEDDERAVVELEEKGFDEQLVKFFYVFSDTRLTEALLYPISYPNKKL